MAIVAILIIAVYLFWKTIVTAFLAILRYRKHRRSKLEREEGEMIDQEANAITGNNRDESHDIYKEMNIANLRSHYVRMNKER